MGFQQQPFGLTPGRRAVQPKGELPLQIRCRCSGERLPAQGMVVVGARRSARLARPSPSVAPDRDAYCAGGAKAR